MRGASPRPLTGPLSQNAASQNIASQSAVSRSTGPSRHVVTAVVDTYVDIRWWQAFVPWVGASYMPLWLGLGTVALDVIAMRPTMAGAQKRIVEYEPPIAPIRFLVYDSVVVLSGVTTVLPTLAEQFDNIFPRITGSLADAGTAWEKVACVSFYLHRSQSLDHLKALFSRHVSAKIPQLEYCFVDGYSSEGKFCEVEVTATL